PARQTGFSHRKGCDAHRTGHNVGTREASANPARNDVLKASVPKAPRLGDNERKGVDMQITLELPEDIAQGMESKWKDLPRAALECLALEAYRYHAITAAQLRRLLAFETRMEVDAFLKEHEVYDFTAADFEQDRETLRQLRIREAPR